MDLLHSDHMPPVMAAMTPFPHAVAPGDPVSAAEAIMRELGVRHVPVQDGDEIVGVVSHRDLVTKVNRALPKADRDRIHVRDVCVRDDLYIVEIAEPLDVVLATMADRHIGSAVVTRRGRLAGIFTVTDACRVLAEILRARYPGGPDDAA